MPKLSLKVNSVLSECGKRKTKSWNKLVSLAFNLRGESRQNLSHYSGNGCVHFFGDVSIYSSKKAKCQVFFFYCSSTDSLDKLVFLKKNFKQIVIVWVSTFRYLFPLLFRVFACSWPRLILGLEEPGD